MDAAFMIALPSLGCGYDADVCMTQGNNYPPLQWQFLVSEDPDVLFDLTGSVFKLSVTWPDGSLTKSSDVDAELTIDLDQSILAWAYTVPESRALPPGRLSRYELERWISGTQQSLVRGFVTVLRGDNPD